MLKILYPAEKKKHNWLTNRWNRCTGRRKHHTRVTDLSWAFVAHLFWGDAWFPPFQLLTSWSLSLIHTHSSQSKPSDHLEQRLQIKEPGAFASMYSCTCVVGFGVFLPKSCFSYLPSIFFAFEGMEFVWDWKQHRQVHSTFQWLQLCTKLQDTETWDALGKVRHLGHYSPVTSALILVRLLLILSWPSQCFRSFLLSSNISLLFF